MHFSGSLVNVTMALQFIFLWTLNFLLDIKYEPHVLRIHKKTAYFSFTIQIFMLTLSVEAAWKTSSSFLKNVIK